jgi:carboxylesterase type B
MTYQLIRHKTELAQIFKQAATAALENHPSLVETILSTYGISSAATSDAAFKGVLDFATDILFYASTMKLAQSWPGAAYVYHFNEPNPWDGPYKGEATHILDIAFLFQNYNEYLSDEQRATAKAFAGHLITFVHGEEPYERYDANRGGAMVYGPPVQPPGFVIGLDAGLYGRRREIFDIAGYAALDVVARILDEVMAR